MAFTSVNNSTHFGLADRFTGFIAKLRESRLRYKMYRQTVYELSALNDRELNDLGLHRSAISSIAMEAAYGK